MQPPLSKMVFWSNHQSRQIISDRRHLDTWDTCRQRRAYAWVLSPLRQRWLPLVGRLLRWFLMVTLIGQFFFECLVPQVRWQVVVCEVDVRGTTNLFDGQIASVICGQALTSATTEQVTQRRHVVVPVDASPTTDLKMVLMPSSSFATRKHASMDQRLNATRNSQRSVTPTRPTTRFDRKYLTSLVHTLRHDQSVLFAWQFVSGLTPYREPFDFPDFRTAFRIDVIALP